MAEKQLKKCLTHLAIREMKIQMIEFYLTPVRWLITKTQVSAHAVEDGKREETQQNTLLLMVGMQYSLATLEIKMAVSQKIEKQSILRPSSALLGIHQMGTLSYNKDTCTTMLTAALVIKVRK